MPEAGAFDALARDGEGSAMASNSISRSGATRSAGSSRVKAAGRRALAVLALGFGLISFNWPGSFGGFGTFLFFGHGEDFHFEVWLGAVSIAMAVAAFTFAYLAYAKRSISLEGARSRFAGVLKVVENKYYFDEVYQWTVDRVVLVFSGFIAYFDRAIVNDIMVNGPADVVRVFGIKLRLHVTGHVYSYTLAMAIGTIGLAIFVWLRAV